MGPSETFYRALHRWLNPSPKRSISSGFLEALRASAFSARRPHRSARSRSSSEEGVVPGGVQPPLEKKPPGFLVIVVMNSARCGVYTPVERIGLMEPRLRIRSNLRKRSATSRDVSEGTHLADGEGVFLSPASVEALYRQSYRSIVQSLALAGGDLAAAEDATQEAFAQAWVSWNRISRYDNPGAWVRRVAINRLRNAHRSHLRGQAAMQRMTRDAASVQPSDPEPDVVLALQRLPYKQRICAVLYYVDGLNTAEIAQTIGISQGSVSQHLNRARTALRAHLEVS